MTATDNWLQITAAANTSQAVCPRCAQASARVHSHYLRSPHDLPCSERRVRLNLLVRRFLCLNPDCSQRTFAERLPDFLPPYAQRTTRFSAALRAVALALGGEAGARLAVQMCLPVSGDTLLRVIRQAPSTILPTPRALGVDDWALRKGRVYGTLLIDLERGQPVDLLPDRSAETLAGWLQQHPGVEIITRDRSTEYARGATLGAPGAVQVADRWHILKNLREVLERLLDRLRPQLRQHIVTTTSSPTPPAAVSNSVPQPRRSNSEEAVKAGRRLRGQELYEQVRLLHAQGTSILQISKRLAISRTLVRRFISMTELPERATNTLRGTMLDEYEPYLLQRWADGCRQGVQLWRELMAQGYAGTRKPVARWVQRRREEPAPTTPKKYLQPQQERQVGDQAAPMAQSEQRGPTLGASRQIVWLLMRGRDELTAPQAEMLDQLCQEPGVAQAYGLGQQFLSMVRERADEKFDGWLDASLNSEVSELRSFAEGLDRDYSAVRNGIELEWSNGPVEGQVNRLKMLKRQMYGRAGFDLLKQRVLFAA